MAASDLSGRVRAALVMAAKMAIMLIVHWRARTSAANRSATVAFSASAKR